MTMTMQTAEQAHQGAAVEVFLTGDLDLESAPALRAWAEALDAGIRQVVLDLREVTFLDSTGISVLIQLQHEFGPDYRMLVIRGAQGRVRDVLEVSGVGEVLHLAP